MGQSLPIVWGRRFERRKIPPPSVQTKFLSAEGAITVIKEPLAAKMSALKRAKFFFIVFFYTLQLFISCFNKCVKRFFGYTKYDSVTCMFANLGIANAQSRLLSSSFNSANQLWHCHNSLVRLIC